MLRVPADAAMERTLERNARLIVALRHLAAEMHAYYHSAVSRWTDCDHAFCCDAKRAIDSNDRKD